MTQAILLCIFIKTGKYFVGQILRGGSPMFVLMTGTLLVMAVSMKQMSCKRSGKIIAITTSAAALAAHVIGYVLAYFALYVWDVSIGRNVLYTLTTNDQIPKLSTGASQAVMAQILLYFMVLVAIVVAITLIHGKSRETLFELLILAAGYASAMIIGFSPTVYASGARTLIFLYTAMIIVILRNVNLWLDTNPTRNAKIGLGAAACVHIGTWMCVNWANYPR